MTAGASTDAKSKLGFTPLQVCAQRCPSETVAWLLDEGAGLDVRANNYGQLAIHLAAYAGRVDSLRILLSHGADANARAEAGWSALQSAAKGGSIEATELLLSTAAVSVDDADEWGRTALHSAAEAGHAALVRRLIEHGASASARNSAGETPLDVARGAGHGNVVELLSTGGS